MVTHHAGKKYGFVLFIVLVYMQALILAGAAALEMVDRDMRNAFLGASLHKMNNQAEVLLSMLETSNIRNCNVPPISSVDLRSQSVAWWQGAACHRKYGVDDYYFIRERLFQEGYRSKCNQYKQHIMRAIYRNTLLYVPAVNESQSIILQSVTQVKAGNNAYAFKRLSLRRLW